MQKKLISTVVASCFACIGMVNAAVITDPQDISTDATISDDINISQSMGEGQSGKINLIRAYGPDDNSAPTINLTGKNISVNSSVNRSFSNVSSAFNFTGVLSAAFNHDNVGKDGSTLNLGGAETENINVNLDVVGTGKDSQGETTGLSAIGLFAYTQHNGVQANEGGQINAQARNIVINVHSEYGQAYGVLAQNSTTASTAENTATVRLKGERIVINATAGESGSSSGLVAFSQGRIIVDGNLEVNAQNAIVARGDAKVVINEDKSSVVKLNGNVDFNYDKKTSGTKVDADVTVNLSGADSYWNGTATYSYGTGEAPSDKTSVTGMKLGLYNGAQWTPDYVPDTTGSEPSGEMALAINDLSMDGGIVNVKNEKVDVKVNNMSGQGTVRLATDGSTAGTFKVDSAAENSSLTVKLTNEDMSKELTADDVTSEQAKDLLGNVETQGVETTMKVDEGMYNGAFDVMEDGSTITRGPNSVMQSSLELATVAPLALNRILTNDVHKRMGDIRSMKQTSGAWARYDGGKLSGASGLENDFHTIQVGVDTVPAADAPRFGVAFSYTTSDADYKRGEADMDVYSLAAYGLWMGESGQFVDVVARLGTAKTDMTVDGNKKGSMNNIVTALSGEFGWRFDIAKSFYLEPQVELAYTHVDADDLSLSDGSTYRFDDGDSLMGRAGFMFGVLCPDNGNMAYLRVSAVHEFLGDNAVTGGNGTVYEIDGKDTWVEYGLGANFKLSDSTYVWADVERTSGGYLDEDWRATVGVRYAF